MRNREFLNDLSLSQYYTVIEWLINDYGERFADKQYAVCDWLNSETIFGEWQRVHGYVTPGGDPLWCCPRCKKSEHVYGIEHNKAKFMCDNCGCINLYFRGADQDDTAHQVEYVRRDT